MLRKFLYKAVFAPFASTVMAKVGEAVGDRLGYLINPPDPSDCDHSHVFEGDIDGELVRRCVKCGEDLSPAPTEE